MDNRDFFDEEFDRINGSQDSSQAPFDSWSNDYNNYQPPEKSKQNKPFKIVFTAILMVVCIVVGWVLAVITNDTSDGITGDTDDERKDILNEVFNTMDYNFYEEITDEEWQLAVEQAGSALMQYAGDQFCFLMSPQTYYDYMYGGSTVVAASNINELFGISYTMESTGMIVSSVVTDSASYGRLYEGDLIFAMSNIKEYIPITDADGNLLADENGNLRVKRYSNGSPILANSPYTNGILLEGATTTQIGNYLILVYSATFHVLRDGKVIQVDVARNKVGIAYDEENVDPNKRYDFQFVEYYISDSCNNISTTAINGAGASTYEVRGLSNLPEKTAYVHLLQFDQIVTEDEQGEEKIVASCDEEFKAFLQLFKNSNCEYLVLDLKDNPGGYVHLTVNIAGMLIHQNNLSANESMKVQNYTVNIFAPKGGYLVTRITDRHGYDSDYAAKSTYYNYFPQSELDGGKKRIIIWTDGGSASASELLTGTLLDYQTAVHMGTNTYGKGIAQTIDQLDITGSYTDNYGITHNDGYWYVYYTFANYYSPLGTNIQGVGYNPDEAYQATDYADLWALANSYWGF